MGMLLNRHREARERSPEQAKVAQARAEEAKRRHLAEQAADEAEALPADSEADEQSTVVHDEEGQAAPIEAERQAVAFARSDGDEPHDDFAGSLEDDPDHEEDGEGDGEGEPSADGETKPKRRRSRKR